MSRNALRAALFAAASGIVVATPAPAEQSASATQSAAQAGPAEQIVVTARRRPEDVQKIPVAVTPISGDTVRERNISSALDLQNNAPSLSVTGQLGERDDDVFTIRGQTEPFGGADPGVQTYFAEVPFNASGVGNYYDLDNIQVLNGPQGTLFGRNTTGGAVLFEPKRPTDEFGGYLDGQVGNHSFWELSGAVNVPIVSDKLDVRIAGDTARRDGFTDNVSFHQNVDNVDYDSFRAGVTFRPSAQFENYFVFDYLRNHTNGTGAGLTAINLSTIDNLATQFLGAPCSTMPLDPTCQALAGFEQVMAAALAQQKALGKRKVTSSIPLFFQRDSWGATDIATYNINDHLRIRNIFGYREDKIASGFDFDGSFLPLLDVSSRRAPQSDSRQVTEEIQLQGETDAFTWLLGFYHESDQPAGYSEIVRNTLGGTQPPQSPFAAFGSTEVDSLVNGGTSNAVFGQATYDLSQWYSGLSVTAGGRYTWDSKFADSKICFETAANFPFLCPSPLTNAFKLPRQSADFHAPTWTLALDYQATPKTMLYVTYRRGYKSGGFNSGAPSSVAQFDPEYLTDVEIGAKNNWTILGAPGRTDFDAYYGWYRDVQKNDLIAVINPPAPPQPVALTLNAAKATIKGIELQTTIMPSEAWEFSAFYSYTDASYDKFLIPGVILIVQGHETFIGEADHAGDPFAFTPENKLGVTLRFHIPVNPRYGMPVIGATWYYQSKSWFSDFSDIEPDAVQGGYSLVNLRLDWNNLCGTPFDAALFVNNVTDETYKVGGNPLLHLIGTSASIYGPPRLWGFELRYRFGADAAAP